MTSAVYTVRRFRPEADRDALLRLWAENMPELQSREALPERMRWLYVTNPSGPAATWLAVADGSVIGCGSLRPRRMFVGGRLMNVGILFDFAVDRRHRLAGPAIILQRTIMGACREAGFDFLMGWPNEKSVAVMKRIGYTVVGAAQRWVKPLRTSSQLANVIASRLATGLPNWVNIDLLARVGGPLLDQVLFARDCAIRLTHASGMTATLADQADQHIEDLWVHSSRSHIVGERTSAYLNWRYSRFPTDRYGFCLLTERRSDKLLGYAAYGLRGDTAVIADLFVRDIDQHLDPLLLGLAAAMRRESVRTLSLGYVGTRRICDHLRHVGFFDRGGSRPLIVWLPPGTADDLRVCVTNLENWQLQEGELDI